MCFQSLSGAHYSPASNKDASSHSEQTCWLCTWFRGVRCTVIPPIRPRHRTDSLTGELAHPLFIVGFFLFWFSVFFPPSSKWPKIRGGAGEGRRVAEGQTRCHFSRGDPAERLRCCRAEGTHRGGHAGARTRARSGAGHRRCCRGARTLPRSGRELE